MTIDHLPSHVFIKNVIQPNCLDNQFFTNICVRFLPFSGQFLSNDRTFTLQ